MNFSVMDRVGGGLRLDLSVFNGSVAQLEALTLRTSVSLETGR